MKFKFNKKKLIPDLVDYIKILISAFITVYLFKSIIISIFPAIETLSDFWYLVVWVMVVTYFKDLFDLKLNGRDYF